MRKARHLGSKFTKLSKDLSKFSSTEKPFGLIRLNPHPTERIRCFLSPPLNSQLWTFFPGGERWSVPIPGSGLLMGQLKTLVLQGIESNLPGSRRVFQTWDSHFSTCSTLALIKIIHQIIFLCQEDFITRQTETYFGCPANRCNCRAFFNITKTRLGICRSRYITNVSDRSLKMWLQFTKTCNG